MLDARMEFSLAPYTLVIELCVWTVLTATMAPRLGYLVLRPTARTEHPLKRERRAKRLLLCR